VAPVVHLNAFSLFQPLTGIPGQVSRSRNPSRCEHSDTSHIPRPAPWHLYAPPSSSCIKDKSVSSRLPPWPRLTNKRRAKKRPAKLAGPIISRICELLAAGKRKCSCKQRRSALVATADIAVSATRRFAVFVPPRCTFGLSHSVCLLLRSACVSLRFSDEPLRRKKTPSWGKNGC
jgi:hypothetical protein